MISTRRDFLFLASAALVTSPTVARSGPDRPPADPDVVRIFFLWGQSWETGANKSADRVISTEPAHPGFALMFDNGREVRTPHTLTPSKPIRPLPVSGFIDLVEAADGAGRRETRCSGFANAFIDRHVAAFGSKCKLLMAISAVGGARYAAIGPGSGVYDNMLRLTRRAIAIVAERGQGERVEVAGILTNHGQADFAIGTGRSDYRQMLTDFCDRANVDFPAVTGQSAPVRMFVTQVARGGSWAQPDDPRISMAQRDASFADPRIILVGPGYPFPNAGTDTPDDPSDNDSGHLSSRGYLWNGETEAEAAFATLHGGGWQALHVTKSWRASPTAVRARYSGTIAIDDTGGTAPPPARRGRRFPGLGLVIADPEGAAVHIRAVSMVPGSDDTIEIVHDPAPGGASRLYYSRSGCLRGAAPLRISRSGDPLFAWACVQTADVVA